MGNEVIDFGLKETQTQIAGDKGLYLCRGCGDVYHLYEDPDTPIDFHGMRVIGTDCLNTNLCPNCRKAKDYKLTVSL